VKLDASSLFGARLTKFAITTNNDVVAKHNIAKSTLVSMGIVVKTFECTGVKEISCIGIVLFVVATKQVKYEVVD